MLLPVSASARTSAASDRPDQNTVDERERLRVLGKHWSKHARDNVSKSTNKRPLPCRASGRAPFGPSSGTQPIEECSACRASGLLEIAKSRATVNWIRGPFSPAIGKQSPLKTEGISQFPFATRVTEQHGSRRDQSSFTSRRIGKPRPAHCYFYDHALHSLPQTGMPPKGRHIPISKFFREQEPAGFPQESLIIASDGGEL